MTANDEFAHLRPEARQHALESVDTRISRIRSDRFIPFPGALAALTEAERLLKWPECACMPNLLIRAEPGMGKTTIVNKLLRDHPSGARDERGVIARTIIEIEIPSPDEARIYTSLLKRLDVPVGPNERLPVLEDRALRVLDQIRPRLLIFDEVNNLLLGSHRQQRSALNLLKLIGNKLRVPILATGTNDALIAISVDAQIDSRFNKIQIPRWQQNADFRSFVASLVSVLPLRQRSELDELAALRLVMSASDGNTRNIVRLIGRAAEEAINSGTERINTDLLERSARALGLGAQSA